MTTPKIIHQTWKSKTDIPENLQEFQETIRKYHPDYRIIMYDDNDLRNVVKDNFPQYLPRYDSFKKVIERVDFARYAILYKYGGVYLDMDVSSLKSLDDFVDMKKVVFGTEPKEHMRLYPEHKYVVCNAVMISPPGEEVWLKIMDYIAEHYSFSKQPVQNTGPIAVTDALIANSNQLDQSRIVITKPCTFYPVLDNGKVSSECSNDMRESYTIHHWENSWCWTSKKIIKIILIILLIIAILAVIFCMIK